jgi:hypothetical protein
MSSTDKLRAYFDAIDHTIPGAVTNPDDPRVFLLPPLPEADVLSSADEWLQQALWWEEAERLNPEVVVVKFDHNHGLMYAFGSYADGEVAQRVYGDKATRDRDMAEHATELRFLYT